jgi:hypothetical protein
MKYASLIRNYKVNRPLTEWEVARHLPQDKYSGASPWTQSSVIRMNSTYLECVDRFFEWRGMAAAGGLFVVGFSIFVMANILIITIEDWAKWLANDSGMPWVMLFGFLMFTPILIFSWRYLLREELFRLTHWPMRFNRKNRMVYVTRFDGSVMAEPWDKLYFTLGDCGQDMRDVRAHRLAEDGVTVLETFALASFDTADSPHLLSQWEFIRQYMEAGPARLMDMIPLVMELAGRREPFLDGLARLRAGVVTKGGSFVATLAMPILLVYAVGRWIASITSKIPRWPDEVEEACRIHPDDPYLRDHDHVATDEAFEKARETYNVAIERQLQARGCE